MSLFDRIMNSIEKTLHVIGYITIFAIMIIISINTIGRAFFNIPIKGSYELVTLFLMVIVVFFTLSYSFKKGEHVRVDILYQKFSERTKNCVDSFVLLLSTVLFSFITYQSFQLTYKVWIENHYFFGAISLPSYLSYIWVPIGCGVLTLRLLIDLIKNIKKFIHIESSSDKEWSE